MWFLTFTFCLHYAASSLTHCYVGIGQQPHEILADCRDAMPEQRTRIDRTASLRGGALRYFKLDCIDALSENT